MQDFGQNCIGIESEKSTIDCFLFKNQPDIWTLKSKPNGSNASSQLYTPCSSHHLPDAILKPLLSPQPPPPRALEPPPLPPITPPQHTRLSLPLLASVLPSSFCCRRLVASRDRWRRLKGGIRQSVHSLKWHVAAAASLVAALTRARTL